MQETSKRQAWFCSTGLPSDIDVDVGDITFHLHKFPLMTKSKKLNELITEHETTPASEEETDEIHEKNECCHISLPDFPGGSVAFEAAAKFCYTVKIELSPSNVAAVRCAGEVLEMTEEYCENNLISKTEKFLTQNVFKSVADSIKTLKTCEELLPLAESLGIVERCIDSIVSKASNSDPSLFGWPVNEVSVTQLGENKWFDDVVYLNKSFFNRLITAIKSRNLDPKIVENCLISYAKKHIPGVSRVTRRSSSSSSVLTEVEQKELLETVVTNLPEATGLRYTFGVTLLFGMLRAANILKASDSCQTSLERKIGMHLDEAALDDVLIPSYSYLIETLYDVDCVQRILDHFLQHVSNVDDENRARSVRLTLVGKLIDGYLSEIASDTNLKPEKFLELALALPERARVYDDGLYRSVDIYLKAHPWIKEDDREKICGVLDCRKLSLEACTHAAQNERLPLRAVVQVLFFEQLQLRQAIAGTLMTSSDIGEFDVERIREAVQQDKESVAEGEEGRGVVGMWSAAVRQNQVLKLDMDSMRTRVHHLERECSTMKKAIRSMDEVNPAREGGWRESIAKKLSCKFKTQVCDSHEPTIVEARKGRTHKHQKQQ